MALISSLLCFYLEAIEKSSYIVFIAFRYVEEYIDYATYNRVLTHSRLNALKFHESH